MLSIVAPLIVFGLVVFVHELGHFLAAKLTGVYAPRFSIGFGPALWKFRRGETEYMLSALPLGGYVRMASREDETMAMLEGGGEKEKGDAAAGVQAERGADYDPEAMVPFGPKPVPENRWFESKPLYQRLFIMLAGVSMNALLALVIYIGLSARFGRTIVPTHVIGGVHAISAAPSLPTMLGVGDTINAIDGKPVNNWNQVRDALLKATGETVTISTQKGTVTIPEAGQKLGDPSELFLAFDPFIPTVIDSVVTDMPAAKGGLLANDSIVALNGSPIISWSQMQETVSGSPAKPVKFSVIRRGEPVDVDIIPRPIDVSDPVTGKKREIGQVGVLPRSIGTREKIGLGDAIADGARFTVDRTMTIVVTLKRLFTGRLSVTQLGGPIMITRASVAAAKGGLEDVLSLLAFLSLNVAVFNLLPVPILDGGQIVLNIVESAKGSGFSLRTREYIMRVGLVAIALLFVLVMFNDIKGLWQHFFS